MSRNTRRDSAGIPRPSSVVSLLSGCGVGVLLGAGASGVLEATFPKKSSAEIISDLAGAGVGVGAGVVVGGVTTGGGTGALAASDGFGIDGASVDAGVDATGAAGVGFIAGVSAGICILRV